jgi:hypothetical protein
MDYLGKGEMLTNRDVNIYLYGTFLGSFISAHERWDHHFTCLYFVQAYFKCGWLFLLRHSLYVFVWTPGRVAAASATWGS